MANKLYGLTASDIRNMSDRDWHCYLLGRSTSAEEAKAARSAIIKLYSLLHFPIYSDIDFLDIDKERPGDAMEIVRCLAAIEIFKNQFLHASGLGHFLSDNARVIVEERLNAIEEKELREEREKIARREIDEERRRFGQAIGRQVQE